MTGWCSGNASAWLQEVPGSLPVSGNVFYVLFFCWFCVFMFCLKTHYLSQKFAIPFAMLIYLVYLTYCPVLHHCVVICFWFSGIMECTCMLFTFEKRVPLMRYGSSVVLHHSLPLMNSFNKTEAAVFSCMLCFLRAFLSSGL